MIKLFCVFYCLILYKCEYHVNENNYLSDLEYTNIYNQILQDFSISLNPIRNNGIKFELSTNFANLKNEFCLESINPRIKIDSLNLNVLDKINKPKIVKVSKEFAELIELARIPKNNDIFPYLHCSQPLVLNKEDLIVFGSLGTFYKGILGNLDDLNSDEAIRMSTGVIYYFKKINNSWVLKDTKVCIVY